MKKAIILILAIASMVIAGTKTTYASTTYMDGPEIVIVSKHKGITIYDVITLYDAGESKIQIVLDEFTGFANKVGDYNVTLGIANSNYTKKIKVQVKDLITNKVYLAAKTGNAYEVYVPIEINKEANILSEEEIIRLFGQIGAGSISNSDRYAIITDTYSANAQSEGLYTFETRISSTNGRIQNLRLDVNVIDLKTLDSKGLGGGDTSVGTYVVIGIVVLVVLVIFIKKKKR